MSMEHCAYQVKLKGRCEWKIVGLNLPAESVLKCEKDIDGNYFFVYNGQKLLVPHNAFDLAIPDDILDADF